MTERILFSCSSHVFYTIFLDLSAFNSIQQADCGSTFSSDTIIRLPVDITTGEYENNLVRHNLTRLLPFD